MGSCPIRAIVLTGRCPEGELSLAWAGRCQQWARNVGGTFPWTASAVRRRLQATVAGASALSGVQQATKNWYGPGESDCLIKTKQVMKVK